MMLTRRGTATLMFIFLIFPLMDSAANAIERYSGSCDGSAAVSIGTEAFISASDEDNILRVYRYGQSAPIQQYDLNYFLQLDDKGKEVDIEGAAKVGNRIYWIGSHSRDKKGNKEPNRARLFATEVILRENNLQIVPVGVPYKKLKDDLFDSDALLKYKLKEAAKIAPHKSDGLNIEGLAATQDGKLLIAFRNPLYKNKALIIPLDNPGAVISGKRAKLGAPILLPLDGRGIRSIEYLPERKKYLIIAGSSEGDAPDSAFQLYEWPGPGTTELSLVRTLKVDSRDRIQPEAVFMKTESDDAYILSDDGEVESDSPGVRCKDLRIAKQSFRGFSP